MQMAGLDFDLRTNNIAPKMVPNPSAGTVHSFCAYRLMVDSSRPVALTASRQGAVTDNEADRLRAECERTSMPKLIETDFPFARLSQIAEHESWRKEVYRPVYYLHKWWAQRLRCKYVPSMR